MRSLVRDLRRPDTFLALVVATLLHYAAAPSPRVCDSLWFAGTFVLVFLTARALLLR